MHPTTLLLPLIAVLCACSTPPPPPGPDLPTTSAAPDTTSSVAVEEPTPELPPTKASIKGEAISYEAGGVQLEGYLAYDGEVEGKRPAVLVVHEWWGHNDYVRKRAEMLAELGYTAFALDMYGKGKLASHPDDAKKFMQEVMGTAGAAKARFDAAMALVSKHPTVDAKRVAAIGYCFGGAVVLHQARFGAPLLGVVSFHGALGTETPAAKGAVKSKVLVLHGADDAMIPAAQVDAFKKEMDAAGADYRFVAYPGALHAFTNPAATRMGKAAGIGIAYNADADAKSWAEMKDFLAKTLGKP